MPTVATIFTFGGANGFPKIRVGGWDTYYIDILYIYGGNSIEHEPHPPAR